MSTVDAPRSPYARTQRSGTNWEKWGWMYMRASGVVLVVLIFGHLFVNMVSGEGVKAIDFAFVAGKWATPFWQWWDLAMLWLALIHGANGLRIILVDFWSKGVKYQRTMFWVVIGLWVVLMAGFLPRQIANIILEVNGQ